MTTITLPFVEMEDCLYHSIVRGHHVYKSVWTPYIGEVLPVQEELGNEHDSYAVSVQKAGIIVGHVPHEVSRIFTFFIRHGGTTVCEVTGHRKPGKGLEVPCCYKLTGKPKHIKKALKLLVLPQTTASETEAQSTIP